jgi:hypothetical protein
MNKKKTGEVQGQGRITNKKWQPSQLDTHGDTYVIHLLIQEHRGD